MNKATKAWDELRAMDELNAMSSPIHSLHPLPKLLITILYIALVVSFPKYALSEIIIMVIYPLFVYQMAGISIKTCFYKLRFILPLVLAVGIVNPFMDKVPMFHIGNLAITTGVISMLTLMCKGIFSLMASFILVATAKIDELCAALRQLHVPDVLVTLFLLTYRYISVMVAQVAIMSDAYALRAPGQKGIRIDAWGSFLGQLLLRSMDKSEELYQSMQLRGFNGTYTYAKPKGLSNKDLTFFLITSAVLLCIRFGDLGNLIGGFLIR